MKSPGVSKKNKLFRVKIWPLPAWDCAKLGFSKGGTHTCRIWVAHSWKPGIAQLHWAGYTIINVVCCVGIVEIQKKVGELPIRTVYSLTFRALALCQRVTLRWSTKLTSVPSKADCGSRNCRERDEWSAQKNNNKNKNKTNGIGMGWDGSSRNFGQVERWTALHANRAGDVIKAAQHTSSVYIVRQHLLKKKHTFPSSF